MDANSWAGAFGDLARQTMSSPELERYFSIPITKARAQLILQQLSLYVRHRRDCWAYVSGNTPVLAVKQKILGHEYEEMIRDQHSEHGHLDLIIRQGKCIGLSADDILNAKPIPSTTATLYAWGWMCKKKHWLEGLAAMSATEWNRSVTRRFGRRSRLSNGPALGRAVGHHLGRFAELACAPRSRQRTRGYVPAGLGRIRQGRKRKNDSASGTRVGRALPRLSGGYCRCDGGAGVSVVYDLGLSDSSQILHLIVGVSPSSFPLDGGRIGWGCCARY